MEKALEALKDGENFDKIKEKFGQSSVYRAFKEYFPFAEKTYLDQRKIQQNQDMQIRQKREKIDTMDNRILEKGEILQEMKKELDATSTELELTKNNLAQEEAKLKSITERLEALEEKNVTPEIIGKIEAMEFKSGKDLFEKVKSSEEFHELEVKKKELSHFIVEIEANISEKNIELEQNERTIRDTGNKIDELLRRYTVYEDIIKLLQDFLEKGYDLDILLLQFISN